MHHEATRVDHAVRSMRRFVTWTTSKRGFSIIFLNAILAGAVILSILWLRDGLPTVKFCVRFQCPPHFTSARLPKTLNTNTGISHLLNRHSGYLNPKNQRLRVFHERARYLVPPAIVFFTDNLGFRKHQPNSGESRKLATKGDVLALGDSFTAGWDVDDLATWPAYLERATAKTVYNAGIGGYGSAQAVAHGHAISPAMNVDTVILSVLVNEDIKRDQRVSYNKKQTRGRRPVVDRNGVLMHLPPYSAKVEKFDIIHAEVADMHSLMDYVLQRLLHIPANKHILLLQYGANPVYLSVKEAQEERVLWVKKAKAWSIPVVDTFDVLRKEKDAHRPLWINQVLIPPVNDGHHTSYGNEIVAQAILDSGVLD